MGDLNVVREDMDGCGDDGAGGAGGTQVTLEVAEQTVLVFDRWPCVLESRCGRRGRQGKVAAVDVDNRVRPGNGRADAEQPRDEGQPGERS